LEKYGKILNGFEGYYQISNYGRIKSLKRNSSCCYGKERVLKEKEIYPCIDKNGYFRIMLSKNKDKKRFYIHELVARAFCKNYKEGKIIHHIDYNKTNNFFQNLYICDRKEHRTIHNLTDRLVTKLVKNGMAAFYKGQYFTKEEYEAIKYTVGE
jgi:hypothetical protein